MGTKQDIRLKDVTLSLTPITTVSRIIRVEDQSGFATERLYIAIKVEIVSRGPGTWRPSDHIDLTNRGICLNLSETDTLPSCGLLYSEPQFQVTTGKKFPCLSFDVPDRLWWEKTPELSLKALKPGGVRSGWLTWCLAQDLFSVNLVPFKQGLVLRAYGAWFPAPLWKVSLSP